MEAYTTLRGTSTRTGSGKNGPWTMSLYETDHGQFQTFDTQLAGRANALIGQFVKATYEAQQRGSYVNNVLQDISISTPSQTIPTPPQALLGLGDSPYASPPYGLAPAVMNSTPDTRQVSIHRQSGLKQAIQAVASGVVSLPAADTQFSQCLSLFRLSDIFQRYFEGGRAQFEEMAENSDSLEEEINAGVEGLKVAAGTSLAFDALKDSGLLS